MKALLGVVLIAFVAQATAQNRPNLRCFECVDCPTVIATTPRRLCYTPLPNPTLQTHPTPPGLTTSTTTTPMPNLPAGAEQNSPDEYFQPARPNQLWTCFTIRREIGDRHIVDRGCALIHATHEETCSFENQGVSPASCQLCDDDECNDVSGVNKIFASISLILATLFIALRLH